MRLLPSAVVAMALMVSVPAAAQVPTQDSASGSGRIIGNSFNIAFQVNARTGPGGDNPVGRFTAADGSTGETLFDGPITCLSVRGNVATMNVMTSVFGPGFSITTELTDNATVGRPDQVVLDITTRTPTDCSPLPAGFISAVLAEGDIAVIDAPAALVSKDQCKNGGWKLYEVFKNQGDCVSFVATKGKNPPTG
jgi:hypothetical protein